MTTWTLFPCLFRFHWADGGAHPLHLLLLRLVPVLVPVPAPALVLVLILVQVLNLIPVLAPVHILVLALNRVPAPPLSLIPVQEDFLILTAEACVPNPIFSRNTRLNGRVPVLAEAEAEAGRLAERGGSGEGNARDSEKVID